MIKFFIAGCLILTASSLPAQTGTLTESDLQTGDILMYNGNSFISKLIMFFDGGDYSHTGIYDGEKVLEAVDEGVKTFSPEESVKGVNYVDVYRFKNLDSTEKENLASVINKYRYFGDRYSYEQFMLLGVLTITRKIPLAFLAPVLRSFLERSGKVFTAMLSGGRQPMICSELVYRCYLEADTSGKTKIEIPQTKIKRGSLSDIALALGIAYLEEASKDIDEDELPALKSELKKFKKDYTKADPALDMDWTESDFVTPSDLQNSPSLVKLGRLKLD